MVLVLVAGIFFVGHTLRGKQALSCALSSSLLLAEGAGELAYVVEAAGAMAAVDGAAGAPSAAASVPKLTRFGDGAGANSVVVVAASVTIAALGGSGGSVTSVGLDAAAAGASPLAGGGSASAFVGGGSSLVLGAGASSTFFVRTIAGSVPSIQYASSVLGGGPGFAAFGCSRRRRSSAIRTR